VGPLDKIVEFDASYGNTQTWYKCPDVLQMINNH